MPDSKRFLHPEAIKRISRLELRARHIVEGFLSGMHRSPYFGQSVEFLQHREYAPGDDLRHVDWKVWAKQDRFYVKQFEEDTNLRCTLLVDVSNSMALRQRAADQVRIRLHAGRQPGLPGAASSTTPSAASPSTSRCACRCPSAASGIICCRSSSRWRSAGPATRPTCTASSAAWRKARRGAGMMILVSDLLADQAGTLRGLKLLRQRGHDLLVFHILDDDELDFPFTGPTRFEGLESPGPPELQSARAARRLPGRHPPIPGRSPARLRSAA